MTLPILTAKYQQIVLKKQFLKFYSNLQNAYYSVYADYGMPMECYSVNKGKNEADGSANVSQSQCPEFWNQILKRLKVINTCDGRDCVPAYKTDTEVIAAGGSKGNQACPQIYRDAAFNANGTAYTLSDGSFIYVNKTKLEYGIDINGKKGPNKWGYDVFYIRNLLHKNQIIISDGVCGGMWEKGGMRIKDYLLDNKEYDGDKSIWW